MDERARLAEQFEEHRSRLRTVAYRMLGSVGEADDAVQEAWLRASRADVGAVENLGAWLTTVVARVCLNMLRTRASRREEPLDVHVPDPIVGHEDGGDPEHEALLADAVGLALVVVLETLTPAERLAFVLHDMFALPFEEIAPMIERSPAAARQLASRARRRVREQAPAPDPDLGRQRAVVDAFFAAARDGVVAQAATGARFSPFVRPALVNGAAGVVVVAAGRALSVMGFTVAHGKIVAIDVLYDPDRLAGLDLGALDRAR
jgi:RNA polymerase sigma-70 factor (ECF subfamily)